MSVERIEVRVPKAAELVAQQIRRQIVLGDLGEGAALPPETALMAEFSISRPTLREAFRILESEGLITVRRGARGGARVQVPSHEAAARYASLVLQHRGCTIADIVEVRAIVEAPAARWVASRRDRIASADKLATWLDGYDTVGEPERFGEFNALLVQLTENEALILLTAMLEHITRAVTRAYTRVPHPDDERLARKADRTRRKLVELIRVGAADDAEALWLAHLRAAGSILGEAGGTVVDAFT